MLWSLLGTVRISQLLTLLVMALVNTSEVNTKSSYLCLIAFSSSSADTQRCFKLGSSETFLYDHNRASYFDFSGIIFGLRSKAFYTGAMFRSLCIALS